MASAASIKRIIWLLRMAANQKGTPAGETYAKKAQELQDRHGIVVTLEEALGDDDPASEWYTCGTYQIRELWRDITAFSVQRVYNVEVGWERRGNLVALGLRDPEGDKAHLRHAVDTYQIIEQAIEYFRFMVPPFWAHRLGHEKCVALFRAGIANGIWERLYDVRVDRVRQMLQASPDELVLDATTTALVPLQRIFAPSDDEQPGDAGPPRDFEVPEEQSPEAQVFGFGREAAQHIHLPKIAQRERS